MTSAASEASFEARAEGPGTWLVVAQGEIDLANRDVFTAVVDEALAASPERLVFDLANVEFMDSSGLAVLVSAANKAKAVEIRSASQIVRRVIEVSGLAQVLVIDR